MASSHPEPITECTPADGSSPITLKFEGIMVHHSQQDSFFEVGIVPSPDHKFRIDIKEYPTSDDPPQVTMPKVINPGDVWWLVIVGRPTRPMVYSPPGGICRCVKPTERKKSFDWIIDFEGPEFYDQPVEVCPGLLAPILHVTCGEFYTDSVTDDEVQIKAPGCGSFDDFGFVAEVLANDILVADGERLRLWIANTGEDVFNFEKKPGRTYTVCILNTPPDGTSHGDHHDPLPSHLQHYYLLLNQPPSLRFELLLDAGGQAPEPFFCGGTRLSQRADPLR